MVARRGVRCAITSFRSIQAAVLATAIGEPAIRVVSVVGPFALQEPLTTVFQRFIAVECPRTLIAVFTVARIEPAAATRIGDRLRQLMRSDIGKGSEAF